MHASSLVLVLALAASLVLATPTPAHAAPSLQRRQVNPLTIGLGAGAVHKAKDNEKLIADLTVDLQSIRQQVAALQATEVTLQRANVPQLRRRQIGTVLGAVGIHKSKHNRKNIDAMHAEIDSLRHDVDILLAQEHLGPSGNPGDFHEQGEESVGRDVEEAGPGGDQHRLVRRQLGIILSPIALHKSRKDRKLIEALIPLVQSLKVDCARIKTAQDARLIVLNRRPSTAVVHIDVDQRYPGRRGSDGDVLASHEDRDYNPVRAPTVSVEHDHVSSGATYGGNTYTPRRRSSSYGAPSKY